jgi:anthranilate synthase/aminodeoxychorismate synthase-like glutamine amidotransferase
MILIIDNYDSFTYNLYQQIAGLGEEVKVARNNKITLDEIATLNPDGIVLSPGPGRPENAGICTELIKRFAKDIPILGICLGHQAIAEAFGGSVISANEIVHGKTSFVFHNNQSVFQGLPQPFKATRYHSLCVSREDLPKDISVLAEAKDGLIMGIKHNLMPCIGVQFHPESITSETGTQLMQNFLNVCAAHKKIRA